MPLKALTANRLGDGAVVYLTAHGAWSPDLQEARATADANEAEALMRAGAAAEAGRLVVGAYLFELEASPGGLRPCGARETIRAGGPSVPADFRPSRPAPIPLQPGS